MRSRPPSGITAARMTATKRLLANVRRGRWIKPAESARTTLKPGRQIHVRLDDLGSFSQAVGNPAIGCGAIISIGDRYSASFHGRKSWRIEPESSDRNVVRCRDIQT